MDAEPVRPGATPPISARVSDDRGQGTVTVIGMLVVALALAGLSIDTTRLIIVRRELQAAADAAALAGASRIDQGVYRSTQGHVVLLEPSAAHADAMMVFASQAPARSWASPAATRERVSVTAWARVDFTFLTLVGLNSTEVSALSRAEPRAPSPPR